MRLAAPAAYAASAALHGALLAALVGLSPPPAAETVPIEIVAVAPPPAPAPPPEPPAPAARPVPRAAVRVPPRAREAAPPPPNAAPPPDAPPPSRAPVRFGVSMSASTTAGGVAAPAGNSLYGELPRTAPAPEDVKPYAAPRYLPPTDLSTLPRALGACRPPPEEYPAEAVRLGIEGKVVLRLRLDETGAIAEASVLEDPGHGLGPAAVQSLRRHCRFEPGRRGAEPVPTEIRYTVRYELP